MNFKYLFLSLFVFPFFHIIAQAQTIQPIQGESTECLQQLENSKQQIIQINNLELVKAESGKYNYEEAGRPEQVTHSINFVVGGRGGVDLMNSPALQKSITADLLSQCEKVGSVVFTAQNSDWVEILGVMPDGSVKKFECAEDIHVDTWGTQVCL